MATSGNFELKTSRNLILEDAAEVGGILDPEGGTLNKSQYTRLTRYLNNMIKTWQADGMQVWTRKKIGIVLDSGVSSYSFNNLGTTDTGCFQVSCIQTTLTSGTTTAIVVASTTGMSATSTSTGNPTYLGIEKTDGTFFWDTITSIDSSTGITLTTGGTNYLTGGKVYYYSDPAPRPLRVLDGYMRSFTGNDTPIKVLTQEEYNRFGVKTTAGYSTQVYYDMQWPSGTIYLYPTVNQTGNVLYLEVEYPFQVFKDSQDLPDFPEEFQNALIYGLAEEIGFRYGMDEKRLKEVQVKAKYFKDLALGMSQENSIYLQPTHNMYGQK